MIPPKVRLNCYLSTCDIQLSCAVCGEQVAAGVEFLNVGPTQYYADEGYVVCAYCTGRIPPFSLAADVYRSRRMSA